MESAHAIILINKWYLLYGVRYCGGILLMMYSHIWIHALNCVQFLVRYVFNNTGILEHRLNKLTHCGGFTLCLAYYVLSIFHTSVQDIDSTHSAIISTKLNIYDPQYTSTNTVPRQTVTYATQK